MNAVVYHQLADITWVRIPPGPLGVELTEHQLFTPQHLKKGADESHVKD